ncbi:MAG: type VI secretion system accessory protein TagJ [Gemmataceae bacterium]
MTATDLFKAGKLQAALDAQLQEVKSAPGDPSRRLFLFELASFAGDLERAGRQIDAIRYDDPERDAQVAVYRALLAAEQKRRQLFRDGLQPRFLAPPPDHVALRLQAVQRLREMNYAEAAGLLRQANEAAPALHGVLNGTAFQLLRDADDLFGTVLEVMAHGEYFWVPLDQIESLGMNAPRFPRDLLWIPARLVLRQGEHGEVFLPALYPNSHEHADEEVRLGRSNDWKDLGEGATLGIGARTFLVGDEGVGLREWRDLQLTE